MRVQRTRATLDYVPKDREAHLCFSRLVIARILCGALCTDGDILTKTQRFKSTRRKNALFFSFIYCKHSSVWPIRWDTFPPRYICRAFSPTRQIASIRSFTRETRRGGLRHPSTQSRYAGKSSPLRIPGNMRLFYYLDRGSAICET